MWQPEPSEVFLVWYGFCSTEIEEGFNIMCPSQCTQEKLYTLCQQQLTYFLPVEVISEDKVQDLCTFMEKFTMSLIQANTKRRKE